MEKNGTGNNINEKKIKASKHQHDNLINLNPSGNAEEDVSKTSDSAEDAKEESTPPILTPGQDNDSSQLNEEVNSAADTKEESSGNEPHESQAKFEKQAIEVETPSVAEDAAEEVEKDVKKVDSTEKIEVSITAEQTIQTPKEDDDELMSKEKVVSDVDNKEDRSEKENVEGSTIIQGKKSEDATEKGSDEHANEIEASDDEEEEEAHLDYSNYTKKQMVQVLESLLKEDDFSQVGRILKEIKKPYDDLAEAEKNAAYERYIEDGGEKDGFEYRQDELDQRFNLAYNKLRERKSKYYNSLEKQKEQNLNKKLEILEKLREIVDSEETGASIKGVKDLQNEWKEVGVIPSSQVKSLWANYNALLDRFYDQRSIYFELKELDRKKNYDLKIELCEKAEALDKQDDIREVIRLLNELHEEFKHIGPVPKEDQEAVWERFKAASDKIYSKRKDYYEKLKGELKLNEVAKEALVEKVLAFAEYNSDRISDWNAKTKEIIAIQKEWEAIGSLPKEKAKAINKKFWTSFKTFFNKKGQFFRKIEEERRSNLKLKQELVENAESLKDSDEFRKTADELKKLQKRWKEIGPVPEKFRNEVFRQFKSACDHFFNRKRENAGKLEKDYVLNLEKKQSLCKELEAMLDKGEIDVERVKAVEAEWSKIGYVPRSNIKSIQKRYTDIIGKITDKVDISETEKHKMRFSAQFGNVNYGAGAERMIQKKEGSLRRQISALENDIGIWQNNMDFFASSKNADKLKKEFELKIEKASTQLKSLKEQLKVISNI